MTWRDMGNNRYEYGGSMLTWMKMFDKWYGKDARGKPHDRGFPRYVVLAAMRYASQAQAHWLKPKPEQAGVYQLRLNDLRRLLTTPSGAFRDPLSTTEVLNLVDFLANNIEEKLVKAWESTVRQQTITDLLRG